MKKEFISVLCPTHKRPILQERFTAHVFKTCTEKKLCEIVFGIDYNDTQAIETANKLQYEYPGFIKIRLVNPKEKLSNLVNLCQEIATGSIYSCAADDVVFRTNDWDNVVRSQFDIYPDKIALVWSDDGIWGGELASHTFLHKNWVDVIGYINAPYFEADWTDKWNQEIANYLGRGRVCDDRSVFYLEHLHPSAGKMPEDETYKKTRALALEQPGRGDDTLYLSEKLSKLRNIDKIKLAKFIQGFNNDS